MEEARAGMTAPATTTAAIMLAYWVVLDRSNLIIVNNGWFSRSGREIEARSWLISNPQQHSRSDPSRSKFSGAAKRATEQTQTHF